MKTLIATLLLLSIGAFAAGDDVKSKDVSESTKFLVPSCGRNCRFEFCDFDGAVVVGPPDVPLTSSICRKDGRPVGVVDSTGQALITDGGPLTAISEFRPGGLDQRFSRSFFKAFKRSSSGTSGVGHQTPQRNQNEFLNGLCVVLPIRSYQLLKRNGDVRREVQTTRPRDCIAFQTIVPKILIELTWQTGDDLDLHVIEPGADGQEIFFENPSNDATGAELLEDNVGACRDDKNFERVVYAVDAKANKGMYEVNVHHFSTCNNRRATKWRVRIFIEGKLARTRRGRSRLRRNQSDIVVGSLKVNIRV